MTVELAHTRTPGPHPDAPTVVLLGSLGSNRSMWDPQVGALARHAHVLTVDARGHGVSPVPPGPYRIEDLGADVLALLDALDLDRVHVVGLSMGGAMAQWLAIHHPARIETMTLLCTAAKFGDPADWTARADAVRAGGLASISSAVVGRWFTGALAARDPELVARHVAMIEGTPDEGYALCCDALAAWDSRADLGRISAPTTVIAGHDDPATPPAMLAELADGIANAELIVLDPAAHLANVEQPEAVTRTVLGRIGADVRGITAPS